MENRALIVQPRAMAFDLVHVYVLPRTNYDHQSSIYLTD